MSEKREVSGLFELILGFIFAALMATCGAVHRVADNLDRVAVADSTLAERVIPAAHTIAKPIREHP